MAVSPQYQEKNLVYESSQFRIWLTDDLDTWWETFSVFDSKCDELQARPEWGEIIARQTELEALPMCHLSEESRRGFRFQIGNGILMLFTEKFEHARKCMDSAEAFYRARTAEKARMWILTAGLVSVVFVTAIGGFSGWVKGVMLATEPANVFEQSLEGAFFGVWGAFISLILRASVLGVDATAGKSLHCLEAACRIITGAAAGALIVCAVAAGIIAPGLQTVGPPMLLILGFVAGFSERLLPSLVGRVESSVQVDVQSRVIAKK